jgi:heme-degrading monooxygenase HmoA
VARPPETGIYAVRATPRRRDAVGTSRVARLTTVQGDPGRIEDLVRQFEAQSAPVLERLPGYLGLYLLVDAETGTARTVAFWQSAEALAASDAAVAPLRAQASETMGAGASPTVELFDVAVAAAGDVWDERTAAGAGREERAGR